MSCLQENCMAVWSSILRMDRLILCGYYVRCHLWCGEWLSKPLESYSSSTTLMMELILMLFLCISNCLIWAKQHLEVMTSIPLPNSRLIEGHSSAPYSLFITQMSECRLWVEHFVTWEDLKTHSLCAGLWLLSGFLFKETMVPDVLGCISLK